MGTVTYLPTPATFADRYKIRLRWEIVDRNPLLLVPAPEDAVHYKLFLHRGEQQMMTYFTATPEHGTPTAPFILASLGAECRFFEKYGPTLVMREENEAQVRRLMKLRAELCKFLGEKKYYELLQMCRA